MTGLSHYYNNGSGNESWAYAYNPAGQLVSQTSSNSNYDWKASFSIARGYGTDGQNRYTTSGSLNLSYDARGDLTSDTQTSQTYDIDNKLTSVSNGAQLGYDAGDRLASVKGQATTQFLYEGDHIIAEYQGGALLRRFVPGNLPDQPTVWYEGSDTSSRRWLLADRQGSTVGIADASASPSYNTYDEAGLPGPSNTGRFQYDGQPWIAEAGLYHMRARAYSPTLGRFMQPDPSGYADGLNLYGYALGDPVNAADPSGLNCDYPAGADEVLVCGAPNAPEGTEGGGGANSYVPPRDGPPDVLVIGRRLPKPQSKLCNATAAVAFVKAHEADAARLAAMNGNTTAEILGLSLAEVGPSGNTLSRTGNNYFSMEGPNSAALPYATGTATTSGGATYATYGSYYDSGRSFLSVYGSRLSGIANPTAFAQALVPGFNSGNSRNGGTTGFVQNTASVIRNTATRMGCP